MAALWRQVAVVESAQALNTRLQAGVAALGLDLSDAQIARLIDYLRLLARWNETYNLTAVRDIVEMVDKHVLDSLAIVPHLRGESLADLGSGAGLPGIPVAIATPARRVYLVESNGKKARFLREAARQLALTEVRVIEARAEAATPPELVDEVTARALARLDELWRLAGRWLKPGGRLLAMKGPGHEDETRTLPAGVTPEVMRLAVPGLDAHRYLVVLSKV